jgi:hypothetical protein
MDILSSLLHCIRARKVRYKQDRQRRTVLRMLAASGVVRSSHIELHYRDPCQSQRKTKLMSGSK